MAQIELPLLLNVQSKQVFAIVGLCKTVWKLTLWLCCHSQTQDCTGASGQCQCCSPVSYANRWLSTSWSHREDFQKETRCDEDSGKLENCKDSRAGRMLQDQMQIGTKKRASRNTSKHRFKLDMETSWGAGQMCREFMTKDSLKWNVRRGEQIMQWS